MALKSDLLKIDMRDVLQAIVNPREPTEEEKKIWSQELGIKDYSAKHTVKRVHSDSEFENIAKSAGEEAVVLFILFRPFDNYLIIQLASWPTNTEKFFLSNIQAKSLKFCTE